MKNLSQFIDLKCLYFEGNGCRAMTGLEDCTKLRSLFLQENIIQKMEGMDTLKDLVILNLNDNCLDEIDGLSGATACSTLYLKRNKLGRNKNGDLAALKGILECPSISCLDISENYLTDPEILPEIF